MSKKTLITIIAILVIAVVGLGAYMVGQSSSKNATVTIKDETGSKTSSVKPAEKEKYQDLVKELEAEFNTNGEKNVEVTEAPNVADSDFPDGHAVITIKMLNDTTIEAVNAAKDNIDSNNGTAEDLIVIGGLQSMITEYAQKLKNDKDAIELVHEMSPDNYRVFAKSTKTKDIIPNVAQ